MAIEVTGVGRTLQALRTLKLRTESNLAQGLDESAQDVLDASKKYVPIDEGDLLASGRVSSNGRPGLAHEAKAEYGGPAAPHAFIVHEDLVKYHEPPTGAKYLERGVRECRDKITARLHRRIKVGVTT